MNINRIGISLDKTFNLNTSLSIHMYDTMITFMFIGWRLHKYYYNVQSYRYCSIDNDIIQTGTFLGWTRPAKDIIK